MKCALIASALVLVLAPLNSLANSHLQYDKNLDIQSRCYADYVTSTRLMRFFNDVTLGCSRLGLGYSNYIEIRNAAEEVDADEVVQMSPSNDVYYCSTLIGECFGGLYPY